MTTQLLLTDLKLEWCSRMAERVLTAMKGKEFTSDDLHGVLDEPEHPNFFGALVAKLRWEGKIEAVGYKTSTRPERNSAVVRVWKVKE